MNAYVRRRCRSLSGPGRLNKGRFKIWNRPKKVIPTADTMKIVFKKFCQACEKPHESTVWYYRPSNDPLTRRTWLCGTRYLLLDWAGVELWKMTCGFR